MASNETSRLERARALAEGQKKALEFAARGQPSKDVLDVLARTAEGLYEGAAHAALLLLDAGSEHWRHGAAPTLPAAWTEALDAMLNGAGSGSPGAALFGTTTVVVADIEKDPAWADMPVIAGQRGLRSCWSTPILSPAGALLGVFALYHEELHEPDAEERDAVAQLANVAALVLDREREAGQRGRAEEALREAQARFDSTLAAAGVATWTWDIANDRVTADRNLMRLFSVSEDEASGGVLGSYSRAIHPDDAPRVVALIRHALESRGSYEAGYRVLHEDGDYRHVIARGEVQCGADGTPAWMPGVIIDVTGQKRAELELRASEERYRALFESIDEGFCVIEMIFDAAGHARDYRFIETNPAFLQHTGFTDAIGRTVRELVPNHDSHWFEIYGRVATTGEPIRFVNEAGAMQRWFDVYAMRVGGPGSARVALLFKDISLQKRTEDELRHLAAQLSDNDRRKDEFLATLAHELRNPLAPLRNGLHIMRIAAGEPAAIDARDMMERQLGNLVRLVNDLLDVARISSGKLEIRKERVPLHTILASAVETSLPLIEAGRHELSFDYRDTHALLLEVDPTRVAQAVSNLLNNAAKYTPPGGSICLGAHASDGEIVITVTDDGVGIPADALPSLFSMFAQVGRDADRSQGGLGIGLSLVRRLVELHGGSASASSAGPGRGSCFTLRLPLPANSGPAASRPVSARVQAPTGGGLRVLIADDNGDAAESLAVLLQMSGHVTRVVHDGLEAVKAAPDFAPDVAFLDIGMPGLDGYAVARALRESTSMQPIVLVALTGRGAASDRAVAMEAGFDRHLTKPCEPEDVEAVLAEIDDARRMSSLHGSAKG